MKFFTPTYFKNNINQIDLPALKEQGIKLLLLDIDNTLVPTSVPTATPEVTEWLGKVRATGLQIAFVSNNSRSRVEGFSKEHGFYYVHRAAKPLSYGFRKAMKHYGVSKRQTCLVGDQLFTDILGANLFGIMCILVTPLSNDEGKGIYLKRLAEQKILKKISPIKFGLIGNPVHHSLSPLLHQEVYRQCSFHADYSLFEPQPDELKEITAYFRRNQFRGFNITVPYKQAIVPFLDELSPEARTLGVVNTVKIENGKLIGYNTDGMGFVSQVKHNHVPIGGSRIKIIGAGGATPSIVYALMQEGAKELTIYNRTVSKAQAIAEQYDAAQALPLEDFSPADCDILINTTSVGLDENASPVPTLAGISPKTVVFDLIYSPPVTAFLQMAKDEGCTIHNGYEMLVYQGLVADEIWFERPLDQPHLCSCILKQFDRHRKGASK